MKELVIALLLVAFMSIPAQAMSKHDLYKVYHFSVYWPVQVLTFLVAGPGMVVSSVNQHFDDLLKSDAIAEDTAASVKN